MLTKEMNQLRNGFTESIEGAKKVLTENDRTLNFPMAALRWLEGARICTSGHIEGDSFELEVHHPDPAIGRLEKFGTDVNVMPDVFKQIDHRSKYWALLPAGVILKIIYKTTQITDVKLYVDFYFHKEK